MTKASQANRPAAGWQIKLGIALFILSILLPVLGLPLVASMNLSAESLTIISCALLVSAEVLGIIAVAVMGKNGFAYIKQRVFGFFKKYGPPAAVSRTRYTVGLAMFTIPIVFGWLAPYVADHIPAYPGNELSYAIVGDVLFFASLFVLGGDFWDKLRALFIHGAKAVLPNTVD